MGEELIEFFMELLRSIPFKELAVGVLGAIIGGRFTLKGARESHALEFAREKVRSLEGAKRALVLIQIEITAAWDVFYSEYGEEILAEEEGTPNLSILPLSDSNFVVYESLLGELSSIDSDVSGMIVRIYSRARGLVENIKLNNQEAEQCCKIASEYVQSIDKDLLSIAGSRADESVRAEHYSMKALEHAEIINMGNTSQAVRDLAREVNVSLDLLKPAIEKAISHLDEQILLVRDRSKIG
ncbi:hypothetical protein N5E30_05315 [Pseudomonas chengduensis]|jgi:hypothetical protein|nr:MULTISPECIES: hypothetical protein [Pseudomonas]MDH1681004.1 hypothetical protein [Pseudomonas chengduensis]TRO43735.1 hypothetical protein EQ831_06855 [Pseudomonas sp. ALS1279]|tara:strand:+ start:1168 stop:1890 length:723 start_codon:yes stop_codon:yes gene_type:complete